MSAKTFGKQVKIALETLVRWFDQADAARQHNPAEVYEACLTVLIRLAFVLPTESLPAELREAADRYGEESLEHRFEAWPRLPVLSGTLFAPDRFPFLQETPPDDRTILSLLNALQVAEADDVKRIGHVYESLLDYTVKRRDEPNAAKHPCVDGPDSLIVTPSPDRRKTGTHYTPQSLTEEIVRATLEPLVYDGLADGKPVAECRLKKPEEILSLKICDPAMGSGAFLVQACRWLGARLVESWEIEKTNGLRIVESVAQKETAAMRLVAEHCLYGVDIDPRAVELAKLAINRIAGGNELPLGCWERRFRVGDSLLGEPLFSWVKVFPDVFCGVDPGFDAIVGNPPFMGGRKMRKALGDASVKRLKTEWPHASLNADFCAFFFLRGAALLRKNGTLGLLAPDTIAQGDTARTGLVFLTERSGFTIRNAVSSFPWPGKATVVAAWVVLQHGDWQGKKCLNGEIVERISPILDEGGSWGKTPVFPENRAINFQGSVLAGEGFVLSREEAEQYINERKSNAAVIFPYLGGYDLKSAPTFEATRWVIDFRDYSLACCEREWPELLERIRRRVKPDRDRASRAAHRRYWWHHGDKRPALYDRIRRNEFVFALVRHAKHLALARVSTRQVFQESLCLLDLPNWTAFAAIQSTLHYVWAKRGSSTLGEGLRYTPSDYFDTFPFLHLQSNEMERIGEEYYAFRQNTMQEFGEGLTDIYNRFHDPEKSDRKIAEFRELRRQMDETTCAAYGWDDLKLDHDFRKVPYLPANDRIRFTISEQARLEILRRFTVLAAGTVPWLSNTQCTAALLQ